MVLSSVSVLYCRAVVPGQVLAANVFTENVRVRNALVRLFYVIVVCY